MKFQIKKKVFLSSLQKISSLITKNTLYPILENISIKIKDNVLFLTSTNLESEIQISILKFFSHTSGCTTVSGKKILAVCRKLPDDSNITILLKNNKLKIFSENSYYSLTTLPISDFPNFKLKKYQIEFFTTQNAFKTIISATQFSMAVQDLRYFLNGLFLEIRNQHLYAVATDGYRIAICKTPITYSFKYYSTILPRRGVIELLRLLNNTSTLVSINMNDSYFQLQTDNIIFTSKIIEENFPKYSSIILKNLNKKIIISTLSFKQALSRIVILSNEMFQGILIKNNKNKLEITTSNQYDEKAYEILETIYINTDIEISVNAYYLLDILNVITNNEVCLLMNDFNSSIQIQQNTCDNNQNHKSIYVLMPLKM
ncbi:MAG: DNA polymerase III subunit beta [Buchnera aphidicola (Meitanaphis microgallis)]